MIDISKIDYSALDRPEILSALFHPRPEAVGGPEAEGAAAGAYEEVLVPVEDEVAVGGRLYLYGKKAPSLLFFHGNGEIVADYADISTLYARMGVNFLPFDYRGYGRSTGSPTITAMMRDCHVIFDHVHSRLKGNGFSGPLILMGRSLGSASVLELATTYPDRVDGLIIESGFAFLAPLFKLLGVSLESLGLSEADGTRNLDKIRAFEKPTLIIHAEFDHIIPFTDGKALYEASPAPGKKLVRVRGANHNDIFLRGYEAYMKAVQDLIRKAARRRQ